MTLFQFKAKMYALDDVNGESLWKERGVGLLKVKVPEQSVDYDDDGNPIAASFDGSTLRDDDDEDDEDGDDNDDEDDDKSANSDEGSAGEKGAMAKAGSEAPGASKTRRAPKAKFVLLIMRQDLTLQLILNTIVLPAVQFEKGQTLRAYTVSFTAFGADAEPFSVQLKVCMFITRACMCS